MVPTHKTIMNSPIITINHCLKSWGNFILFVLNIRCCPLHIEWIEKRDTAKQPINIVIYFQDGSNKDGTLCFSMLAYGYPPWHNPRWRTLHDVLLPRLSWLGHISGGVSSLHRCNVLVGKQDKTFLWITTVYPHDRVVLARFLSNKVGLNAMCII